MLILSFCCAASAFAGNCKGRIINPITDVCWSCVFPDLADRFALRLKCLKSCLLKRSLRLLKR